MRSASPKSLAQQCLALSGLPVTSSATVRRSRLRWSAELRPTPLSRTYSVALEYAGAGRAPRVRVNRPQLRGEGIERLPHVYRGDVLCLCYPEQWDEGKLIARTIVPWISEWLLHFEFWKVDGIWRGGGHSPAVPEGAV